MDPPIVRIRDLLFCGKCTFFVINELSKHDSLYRELAAYGSRKLLKPYRVVATVIKVSLNDYGFNMKLYRVVAAVIVHIWTFDIDTFENHFSCNTVSIVCSKA